MLTSLELFAGAGGLALGLEAAGFHPKALVEIDREACRTLRHNRPGWMVLEASVADLQYSHFGPVDLLAGGFPCQPFSIAGDRLGFDDPRSLYPEMVRAITEVRPKVVLAENVKGLLSMDGGRTLEKILGDLDQAGYKTHWKVLDATRYGVPQTRQRLIIVGTRKDLEGCYEFPPEDPYTAILGDRLEGLEDYPGSPYLEDRRGIFDLLPEGGRWVDQPEEILRAYPDLTPKLRKARRLSRGAPAPTLLTRVCSDHCHPTETRLLNTREYATIQTFPESWEFLGNKTAVYRQIGNAVPVEMARRIGESLRVLLETPGDPKYLP